MAGLEPDLAGLPSSLALPGLQIYGSNHRSVYPRCVHFSVLLALEEVSCSADCDFDAAGLDSARAVLCFPVADAPLQRPLPPGVSAALLAVALLPDDEHVVLPSLSVPRPTRMTWDRK